MRLLPAVLIMSLTGFVANCDKAENKSKLKYYGADSQEADFTFNTYVEFTSPTRLSNAQLQENASRAISRQVVHLFGSLKDHTGSEKDGVIDFTRSPGVPKTSHRITITNSERMSTASNQNLYRVHYSFKDKAAFAKDFFRAGEQNLPIRLPKNPDQIYKLGMVGGVNACTDEHYNSEGDFWYFWNPYKTNCPKSFMDQTVLVASKLTPIVNTTRTFPEYHRLAEDGVIDITYVVGPDDSKEKSDDLGRTAFEKTFAILTKGKAALNDRTIPMSRGTRQLIAAIPDSNNIVFKVLENKGDQRTLYAFRDGKKIMIQMFFTDPHNEKFAFTSAIRDAIMSADVLLFDGHSGLGGSLPVSRFFAPNEQKFLKDKYQILFFNGCSTFAYYNEEYFAQKITAQDPIGSKNLDIITTSIGAPWSTGSEVDSIFILGILNGTHPTWQKLMDDVYAVDPRSSALTQINGDEDNPTELVR